MSSKVRISPPIAAILRQYMVLASQLFAAGHLSGRRIAVPLLRGTLRCVYTHVTLGDCLQVALLPCHPAQFGARSAHPPSRRCRVAQRRQYCPFVQTERECTWFGCQSFSVFASLGRKASSPKPRTLQPKSSIHKTHPNRAHGSKFRCKWCRGLARGE